MAIGVDIVRIDRMDQLLDKDNFLTRCFTAKERAYIQNKHFHKKTIAGLFAGKEAISKLLGCGIGHLSFQDMEILHDPLGKPQVHLSQKAKKDFLLDGKTIELSISHDGDYSIAVAIFSDGKIKDLDFELCQYLLKRDQQGYKGQYGRVGIIGGAKGMLGSVYMASQSAFRTGSGLVYVVVPKSNAKVMQIKCTETIVYDAEDEGKAYFLPFSVDEVYEKIKDCDVLAIGPGMAREKESIVWLRGLVSKWHKPLVLDADALYACAKDPEILKLCPTNTVITPHEQEMARLCAMPVEKVRQNREEVAKNFAHKWDLHVILKGNRTIITDGKNLYYNSSGNPGMATAGAGDVLTGMVASLLAYGYAPMITLRLATYIHGMAGNFAATLLGEDGLMATDIIDQIPHVMKAMHANNIDPSL